MTKETIIEQTLHAIHHLPLNQAEEISDFAEFIARRYEEQLLTQAIHQLTALPAKRNKSEFLM
jgi:hypothetical protein